MSSVSERASRDAQHAAGSDALLAAARAPRASDAPLAGEEPSRDARVPLAAPPPLDERLGRYRLRFARDTTELARVQELRFEVFNVELGEGLAESWRTRRDADRFDAHCDHLLVEDTRGAGEARTIGTYRLQTAARARAGAGFYSAGEFALETLPADVLEGAVELGRACVAREHRNGRVLWLLWRGLAAYARFHGKRFFFGCSSLTGDDPALGLAAWRWLDERGHMHPRHRVEPLEDYRCRAGEAEIGARTVAIPKLFATYLRYGAHLLGPPALDREFRTLDFLTLLDLAEVAPSLLAQLEEAREP